MTGGHDHVTGGWGKVVTQSVTSCPFSSGHIMGGGVK